MRWLLDEGEIDRSPMERMRPPIVPEKPVPVLTEAHLRALLASAWSASFVDRRDAAIIRLLLDTSGRLSEVAGLAVADLDFTEDVAHVIGKGRRPRAPPFGQQTGLALGRYVGKHPVWVVGCPTLQAAASHPLNSSAPVGHNKPSA
jgi:integrase/recombinase XerC